MSNGVPAALEAIISDVLPMCGIPGASMVGAVLSARVRAIMERRQYTARKILLEELRQGTTFVDQASSLDECVAILLRYSRAAQEGTARLNLRLMAKVISGRAQTRPLVADEFLAWADVLASLRREEVILLAEMVRARNALLVQFPEGDSAQWAGEIRGALIDHLVPGHYNTKEELVATELGLSRTGLVLGVNTYGGNTIHVPSPWMDKLQTLADFQDALRKEGIDLEGNHGYP